MARRQRPPRLLVLGDLMLDVVVVPARPLAAGTDVPGRVQLRQGGSAANTARWLARLGAASILVTAVGRDREGRALMDALRRDDVDVKAVRVDGARTGRIGVLVDPDGERSFVADRGAADRLRPADLRASWFRGLDGVHMPIYSLLGRPLGQAGRRAAALAREAGVPLAIDLSSVGPLLAGGRRQAHALVRAAGPDLIFATAAEAQALVGRRLDRLLDFAPAAIVKRGAAGASILVDTGRRRQLDVPAEHMAAGDTTGAGDAFDAGALLVWAAAAPAERAEAELLRRAAISGHRAARRQLRSVGAELVIR